MNLVTNIHSKLVINRSTPMHRTPTQHDNTPMKKENSNTWEGFQWREEKRWGRGIDGCASMKTQKWLRRKHGLEAKGHFCQQREAVSRQAKVCVQRLSSPSLSCVVVCLLNKNQIFFLIGSVWFRFDFNKIICFRFNLTWKLNFLNKKCHIIKKCHLIVPLVT